MKTMTMTKAGIRELQNSTLSTNRWRRDLRSLWLFMGLVVLLMLAFVAGAAEVVTNAAPVGAASAAAVPATGPTWWQIMTPVIVPMVIGLLKIWIPRIPRAWLPIIAPLIGAAIDMIAGGAFGASTATGAALGLAGVGLREVYDQVNKARIASAGPMLSLFVVALLLGPGCAIVTKQNRNIVGVTQTVIGLQLEQSPANEMPAFRFGYVRSQFHVVPTVADTNTTIQAPAVFNTIALSKDGVGGQTLNEDFATGEATRYINQVTNTPSVPSVP